MRKKALIVIDIQNDYMPGGNWPLTGVEEAAANAARLIGSARAAGDVVVHVRHEFESPEAPFFRPGSTGAEIHRSVSPVRGEHVVLKHRINAFLGTDLKTHLEESDVDEIVICGNMSHMCVDAAARAASDFGYPVTLIHDACASHDLEFDGVKVPARMAHAAFMSALSFAYARTASTDEYLGMSARAA